MKENLGIQDLFWSIMKLSICQILLSAVFSGMVTASVLSGQDLLNQEITVISRGQSLKSVLKNIEKQSGVRFVYSSRVIDTNRKVDFNITNQPMSRVLNQLFIPLQLRYEISGRQILIEPAAPVKTSQHTPVDGASDVLKAVPVRGKVIDEGGEPMPGVNILLKGTQTGTVSRVDGTFELDVPTASGVLVFSFVGYLSQEVEIGKSTTLEVVLKTDKKALEEVVVVGYGAQKKVNLTGAVGTIEAKEFENRPVTNIAQSLQGQVAGLFVNQTGGQPGNEGFTMRIRGTNSFSNNDPLVIVDGIAMSMFNLNPQDIESVSVLKDAASAAIYGARASGGVILITTKKGKDGKMKFSYDGYVGQQSPTMLPEMVNAYEHVLLWREAEYNGNPNTTVYKYNEEQLEKYRTGELPGEDRLAYLFGNAGQMQHNVSMSGGGPRYNFYASLGYLDQKGIMRNTSSKRFNIRLNNSYKVNDRLDINVNAQLAPLFRHAPSEATYPSGPTRSIVDIIYDAYRRGSDDVTFTRDGQWASITGWANRFGLASKDGGFQERRLYRFTGAATVNYKITDAFSINAMYGNKSDFGRQLDYSKRMKFINPLDLQKVDFDYNTNSLSIANMSNFQQNVQVLLNYNKVFGQFHEVKALAGFSQEWNRETRDSLGRRNFITDDIYVPSAGSGDPSTWTSMGTASEWALRSYFGRVNYIFKDKYLLESNIRYDGSSRFADAHRWGIFPSLSLGWRISEEGFMSRFRNFGDLKLRASWGRVGNQDIALYQYYSTIGSSAYYFNGAAQTATFYSGSPNPLLRWETKTTTNLGMDLGLFNGRLQLVLDVFKDRTDGILMRPAVPSTYGLGAPIQNVAVVDNFGWESQISYRDKAGKLDYSVSFQISDARNKVKSMIASPQISNNKIRETGHEIDEWYGYKAIGIFATQEEVDGYAKLNPQTGIGDLKIEDLNNDGKITAADRQRLGSSQTRLPYGFHLSLAWKNFDFSGFLQGVAYRKTYMSAVALPINGTLETAQKQHLSRWHLDGSGNWIPGDFPKMRVASFNNAFSSFWLQNGAYLRIKNVQLGYSLPSGILGRLKLERLRVYVSGENLFTFTKVHGYDPELPDGSGNPYPLARVINAGVNLSF